MFKVLIDRHRHVLEIDEPRLPRNLEPLKREFPGSEVVSLTTRPDGLRVGFRLSEDNMRMEIPVDELHHSTSDRWLEVVDWVERELPKVERRLTFVVGGRTRETAWLFYAYMYNILLTFHNEDNRYNDAYWAKFEKGSPDFEEFCLLVDYSSLESASESVSSGFFYQPARVYLWNAATKRIELIRSPAMENIAADVPASGSGRSHIVAKSILGELQDQGIRNTLLSGLALRNAADKAAIALAFESGTFDYALDVPVAVEKVLLDITKEYTYESLTYHGIDFEADGTPSVSLKIGRNPVSIDVESQDGVKSASYSLIIRRVSAELLANATLQNLVIRTEDGTALEFNYAFTSGREEYIVEVANSVMEVEHEAVPTYEEAVVTLPTSSLAVGPNILEFAIESANGQNRGSYRVLIIRAHS